MMDDRERLYCASARGIEQSTRIEQQQQKKKRAEKRGDADDDDDEEAMALYLLEMELDVHNM